MLISGIWFYELYLRVENIFFVNELYHLDTPHTLRGGIRMFMGQKSTEMYFLLLCSELQRVVNSVVCKICVFAVL